MLGPSGIDMPPAARYGSQDEHQKTSRGNRLGHIGPLFRRDAATGG